MYFNVRLLELLKYLGENTNSFGGKLKSTSGENIRILSKNEKANPTLNILSEIVTLYPNINERWLLTGEGEMIRNTEKEVKNYEPIPEKMETAKELRITKFSCADCIEKEYMIKDLRENISDLRKHIALLELSLGKSQKNGCG